MVNTWITRREGYQVDFGLILIAYTRKYGTTQYSSNPTFPTYDIALMTMNTELVITIQVEAVGTNKCIQSNIA